MSNVNAIKLGILSSAALLTILYFLGIRKYYLRASNPTNGVDLAKGLVAYLVLLFKQQLSLFK